MSVTVLGGGIGGLSAAYYLCKKFPGHKINLIEGSSRTGGWIKSVVHNGSLFEQGPRTIRPRGDKGANTLQLVEELKLQKKLLILGSNDAAVKNRMIYAKNELHSLPSSFLSIFKKQKPFSKPFIYYLFRELSIPKKVIKENDESIYSFVKRRFGQEIADYIISPLMCGICAGDAHDISVKFLMDQMFKYEQQYGSITSGFISNLFERKPKPKITGQLNKCAKKDKWSIYTFQGGLETLPKRLEEVIREKNVKIYLDSNCRGIDLDHKQVTIFTDKHEIKTDYLIACTSASNLQTHLCGHPKLSLLLQKIPYVTVAVVNLHYNTNILEREGFGFLVPPKEELPILGVTFDSCCYPCGEGTVLTVMLGGHWFEKYFGHNPTNEEVLNVAISQIYNTMCIAQAPTSYMVNIHKKCIPQYIIGHYNLVQEIDCYIKEHRLPISLCGAAYNGIGINDVIWSSKTAVDNLCL